MVVLINTDLIELHQVSLSTKAVKCAALTL